LKIRFVKNKGQYSAIVFDFIYSSGYQILRIVLPLVTIPYVTRVLGADNLGVYNFTLSYATYFALFAYLGFENYGNRLIAQNRDDQEQLNRSFSGAYYLQLCSSLVAIISYVIYMLCFCRDNILIAWIQILYVSSEIFNTSWLYFGLEKFKKSVMLNLFVRLISFACIFLFVKSKNDLPIYTGICAGSTLLATLSLWLCMWKFIRFVRVPLKEILSHAKGCFVLFFPVLVISIYRTMDKVMLGHMSLMSEVALYSYADKIVELPYGIIAALGVVMLPRMSNLVAKGENTQAIHYIEKSMRFMLFMACGMAFGLMGIGKVFAPVFFGDEFSACGTLMMVIAPMVIIRACANVVRTQYLLPNHRDRDYIISILIGVLINLVFNSLMIPVWQSKGAAIATLFAESFVAWYQIFACRKEIPVTQYIVRDWFFLLAGMIMFFTVYQFGSARGISSSTLVMQICLGMFVYIALSGAYLYHVENATIKRMFHNTFFK